MKKIVMTGGGTGGHVTQNLALIPRLQQDGGLSPLLVALSDVLPTDLFAPEP